MKRNTANAVLISGMAFTTTAVLMAGDSPEFEITRSTIDGGGAMRSTGGDEDAPDPDGFASGSPVRDIETIDPVTPQQRMPSPPEGAAQSEEPAPPGPVDIDSAQVQANPRDVGALAFPLMDLELRKARGLDGASIDRSPKAMRARIQDRIATLRQLREERQASQREEQ